MASTKRPAIVPAALSCVSKRARPTLCDRRDRANRTESALATYGDTYVLHVATNSGNSGGRVSLSTLSKLNASAYRVTIERIE